MSITKQDIKRMIKEELKKVLVEDLSLLRDMTPGDVLEYMRRELNGKTWFFWDLESIGFDGQITQYGAIAFKIDDIDGPIPKQPIAEKKADHTRFLICSNTLIIKQEKMIKMSTKLWKSFFLGLKT